MDLAEKQALVKKELSFYIALRIFYGVLQLVFFSLTCWKFNEKGNLMVFIITLTLIILSIAVGVLFKFKPGFSNFYTEVGISCFALFVYGYIIGTIMPELVDAYRGSASSWSDITTVSGFTKNIIKHTDTTYDIIDGSANFQPDFINLLENNSELNTHFDDLNETKEEWSSKATNQTQEKVLGVGISVTYLILSVVSIILQLAITYLSHRHKKVAKILKESERNRYATDVDALSENLEDAEAHAIIPYENLQGDGAPELHDENPEDEVVEIHEQRF